MMLARSALWKAQAVLHGKNNSFILPCALVTAASALLVYRHATVNGGDPIRLFLFMIVLQMLPLVFLEMKILSCPDPMAMLSQFGVKVLLMHGCFLFFRVASLPYAEVGMAPSNILGLIGCILTLHYGFNFKMNFRTLIANVDVLGLILLAVSAAVAVEGASAWTSRYRRGFAWYFENFIFTATSYVELLAFMPAVWRVYQSAKKSDDFVSTGGANLEKQATSFFIFLMCFYSADDLITAFRCGWSAPMAAGGHLAHFLLLADFACFLLAHIYNPEKIGGHLMRWLPNHQLFV